MKKFKMYVPLLFLAILPLVTKSGTVLYTANQIMIYVIMGISLNFLTGLSGQASFGHAGLFAVGAYSASIMTARLQTPFLLAFLVSFAVGCIVGFLLSFPCRRIKGSYLSLFTWCFAEIVRMVLINWEPVTGGVNGIRNIPNPAIGPFIMDTEGKLFLFALAVAIIYTYIFHQVKYSRVGTAFLAIKEDPLTVGVLGVDVARYKMLAFIICAGIAASSGCIFAHLLRSVTPDSFTLAVSGTTIQVVLLGGFGYTFAPWLGATVIFVLSEGLRSFGAYREVVIGVVVLMFLLFSPNGLVGIFDIQRMKWRTKIQKAAKEE